MWIKINAIIIVGAWEMVDHKKNTKVMLSSWAFRVNKCSSSLMRILKYHICIRGDTHEPELGTFKTYAPAVSWITICLLPILVIVLDLQSTRVDYTATFIYAHIGTTVYIGIRKNWRKLNEIRLSQPFKPNVIKLSFSVYRLACKITPI